MSITVRIEGFEPEGFDFKSLKIQSSKHTGLLHKLLTNPSVDKTVAVVSSVRESIPYNGGLSILSQNLSDRVSSELKESMEAKQSGSSSDGGFFFIKNDKFDSQGLLDRLSLSSDDEQVSSEVKEATEEKQLGSSFEDAFFSKSGRFNSEGLLNRASLGGNDGDSASESSYNSSGSSIASEPVNPKRLETTCEQADSSAMAIDLGSFVEQPDDIFQFDP